MPHIMPRLALAAALSASLALAAASAQDKPPAKDAPKDVPKEDYREFFKPPETTADFWTGLQFEMEVGRYELAAKLLRGLVDRKATDEELLKLEAKEGSLAPFLRLRTVPRWSDDKAVHDQAVKDANELATRLGEALEKKLGDKVRIGRFVKDLSGDSEERAFAAKELFRSGPRAVPQLLEVLRTGQGDERRAVLELLPRLPRATVAPLTAALDIPDDALRADLIDVLLQRAEPDTAHHLWHLSASPKTPPALAAKARRALATLLERPVESLVPAPLALAREAERYYRHQVKFPDPTRVAVWRWDGKELVQGWPNAATVDASRAEEYYGLRCARQALDLDPTSPVAQEAFLTLALDKAVERAGVDKPLAAAAPEVATLLATVNPDLLVRVLDRGLAERRPTVIVGAVRALGDLRDPRAAKPGKEGDPPLVRALNYPDRRVQLAAAEALLRSPGEPSPSAAARVVEVCRRAVAVPVASKGRPKVLVGFATDALNERVARALADAGFDSVRVRTGGEALRRLEAAADIDAVLIDATLPDPGLAPLLAQLRASVSYGRLPLWIFLPGETQESVRKARADLDRRLAEFRVTRKALGQERVRLNEGLTRTADPKQADALRAQIAAVDQRLAAVGIAAENALLTERRALDRDFLAAPPDRELALTRLAERYPNVALLPQSAAQSATALQEILGPTLADTSVKPLSDAEKKDFTERCLVWLGRMARGELPGYDFRAADDALYAALRRDGLSDDALKAAIDAVGRVPSAKAQTELSAFLLDGKRSPALRKEAAAALQRHVQKHTSALSGTQVQALTDLVEAKDADAGLRSAVALVIGSTRPNARLTGERLKGFDPAPKPAPAPPSKE